jgi:hypothetical protein
MIKIRTSITILLFSILFLLNSCNPKSEEDNNDKTPSQIISIEQAVEMKNFYQDSIAVLIKENNSTPANEYDPTLFAFIELDSLKKIYCLFG